ncbi:MAG: hypothetical protein AB7O66_06765 [Limisphaerales bacterium]
MYSNLLDSAARLDLPSLLDLRIDVVEASVQSMNQEHELVFGQATGLFDDLFHGQWHADRIRSEAIPSRLGLESWKSGEPMATWDGFAPGNPGTGRPNDDKTGMANHGPATGENPF